MNHISINLQKTLQQTLPYFDLPPSELDKTYAVGKWSVRYLLHHLADAEVVLSERIKRGIAHPGQVVYGFHQDDWANHMDYEGRPIEISKNSYVAVRAGIIHLAVKFYESHGMNQYVHSETGLRTVKEEFDKVVWHNQHHLRQIEQALKSETSLL